MSEWKAVVWLDRDGTVVDDPGYLRDPDRLRLLPGAAEAVRRLNEAKVGVVLITNQSGIGRGRMTRADVDAVHDALREQLAAAGARLDAIHLCPHRPDDACDCRKPGPGLVERARRDLVVDPHRPQFCVGDKESDLGLGRATGCDTVLVGTGEGGATRRRLQEEGRLEEWVDHACADLTGAATWILRQVAAGGRGESS